MLGAEIPLVTKKKVAAKSTAIITADTAEPAREKREGLIALRIK